MINSESRCTSKIPAIVISVQWAILGRKLNSILGFCKLAGMTDVASNQETPEPHGENVKVAEVSIQGLGYWLASTIEVVDRNF